MLEVGSVFVPVSGNIVSSLFRRPGAWAWFYFRSFGLIALGLAMYIAFWRHICGPIALPLLAPMSTSLAMVYARWLGILGQKRTRSNRRRRRRYRRRPLISPPGMFASVRVSDGWHVPELVKGVDGPPHPSPKTLGQKKSHCLTGCPLRSFTAI